MGTVEKAKLLSQRAHVDQTYNGLSYYEGHVLTVMAQAEVLWRIEKPIYPLDTVHQVALLHDTVEDSDITLGDLRANGFENVVVNAIDALTHRENEPYLSDYAARVRSNQIATLVKRADLMVNIRSTSPLSEWSHCRNKWSKMLIEMEA